MAGLPIDESKWSHTNRSLICGSICLKFIIKLQSTLLPCPQDKFSKIFFIFMFEFSPYPLVWGWYDVAILWETPYFFRRFSNCFSIKWDPPSLMTSMGMPNRGKMIFLKSLITVFESQGWDGIAFETQSTTTKKMEIVPSSQLPIHIKYVPPNCCSRAFLVSRRCCQFFDDNRMLTRIFLQT